MRDKVEAFFVLFLGWIENILFVQLTGPWGDTSMEPHEIVDQLKFIKPGQPLRPNMAGVSEAPSIVKGCEPGFNRPLYILQ
jgi:hypothetical protein